MLLSAPAGSSCFARGTRLRERLRLLGLVQRKRGKRGRAIHARPGMDTRRGSAHGAVRSWRQQAAGPRGGPPGAHQRERVQAGRHQLLWPEQRVHACLRAPRCCMQQCCILKSVQQHLNGRNRAEVLRC